MISIKLVEKGIERYRRVDIYKAIIKEASQFSYLLINMKTKKLL